MTPSLNNAPADVRDEIEQLLLSKGRNRFRNRFALDNEHIMEECTLAYERAVDTGAPPRVAVRAALTRAKDALHCIDGTRVPSGGRCRLDQGRCGGLQAYQRHQVGGGPTRDPEAAGRLSKRHQHRSSLRRSRSTYAEARKADKCRLIRNELKGVIVKAMRSNRSRKQLEPVVLALFHQLREAEGRIVK